MEETRKEVVLRSGGGKRDAELRKMRWNFLLLVVTLEAGVI